MSVPTTPRNRKSRGRGPTLQSVERYAAQTGIDPFDALVALAAGRPAAEDAD